MTNTEKARDYICTISEKAAMLAAMTDQQLARVDLYDLGTIDADLSDAASAAAALPLGPSEEEVARLFSRLVKG